MRDMFFTGKRKDNGEWVMSGNILRLKAENGKDLVYIAKHDDEALVYSDSDMNLIALKDTVFYNVDPETVREYTGMRDCKRTEEYPEGQMIFEGDIVSFVRYNALNYRCSRTGYVAYYDELPIFYIMATTGDAWDWCDCEEIKIIGNIHDNPELLKGGDPE